MYVNGDFVDRDISPTVRSPSAVSDKYNDFLIGRPNDGTGKPQTKEIKIFVE